MAQRQRPKLFDFNRERPAIVTEVAGRTARGIEQRCDPVSGRGLEYVLNEAAYHEIDRLERFGADGAAGEIGSLGYWRGLARRLASMSEADKRKALHDLVRQYAGDVAGTFKPRVYRFANGVLPAGLSLLFSAQGLHGGLHLRRVQDKVRVEGHVDRVRKLAERGTLIVAPTHVSNLDSPIVGWALEHAGLPPVTYGAGKNLFGNRVLSFFMHNLGAYKVDRRIRHRIYKACLKTYSEVLIERGFHSLFFPGGTRCRSGLVEEKLKLGLLGTGLTAYIRNVRQGRPEQGVYIVPLTLNFGLVLEAEGLIRDHLRAVGKGDYLLPDDPFDRPLEVARFLLKLARMDTSAVVRIGEPLDVLGHKVDDEGRPHDASGRPVRTADYLEVRPGEVAPSPARDRAYTQEAGRALGAQLLRNTVILPTQFVAYVVFEAAWRTMPRHDLLQVLRFAEGLYLSWEKVHALADRVRRRLQELARRDALHLDPSVSGGEVRDLVALGLRQLGMYHPVPAATATPDGVKITQTNLLYYYSNRLRSAMERSARAPEGATGEEAHVAPR